MALARFSSAAFLTDAQLAVAAGATIEVRRESDSGLAALFSDREGTTGITNPSAFADAKGRFDFTVAASPGGFSIEVTSGAETFTLRNVPIGLAQEFDASTYGGSLMNAADAAAARAVLDVYSKAAVARAGFTLLNGYLDWTVSGNALTVAVKTWAGADPSADDPVYIAFRDATVATGLPVVRTLTDANSITIEDTALLGTINSTAFRLWCVAFDDGGTVRLALINCLAGTAPSLNIYPLAGWGIASSTLEDNASDSAHVFYSAGAAVAAKAYATVGYATWETGLATAGTWSAGPTRKQLFGHGVPLPGQTVQTQRTQTGAVATGTTVLPRDDTIPQITEGNEYATTAVTPSSAANVLAVDSLSVLSSNVESVYDISAALFIDAVAGALAANYETKAAQFHATTLGAGTRLLAASTSVRTVRLRAGVGVAGTTTYNGGASTRTFGGVSGSYLEVQEIMA